MFNMVSTVVIMKLLVANIKVIIQLNFCETILVRFDTWGKG